MLQRIGVSSTSVSLSNSLYGDQSEDEGMIGKKEQSCFSARAGGVVLVGVQWQVFAVSFAPALRVTLCEAGVLWEPLHPTGEEQYPIVTPGQPLDVRGSFFLNPL